MKHSKSIQVFHNFSLIEVHGWIFKMRLQKQHSLILILMVILKLSARLFSLYGTPLCKTGQNPQCQHVQSLSSLLVLLKPTCFLLDLSSQLLQQKTCYVGRYHVMLKSRVFSVYQLCLEVELWHCKELRKEVSPQLCQIGYHFLDSQLLCKCVSSRRFKCMYIFEGYEKHLVPVMFEASIKQPEKGTHWIKE